MRIETALLRLVQPPVAPLGHRELLVLLVQLGVLLALALALGRLAGRAALPAVVGELFAGVVLGPSVLGRAWPSVHDWLFPADAQQMHLLDAVGQVGVLLMVGISGLHLDLALVRRQGAAAIRISLFGLVFPLVLGLALGLVVPASMLAQPGSRNVFALFLGAAMCVSAIPVIAKTLMDMNLLHRDIGQLTLTAGMIDDAVGWLMVSVVTAMVTSGSSLRSMLFLCGAMAVALMVTALAPRLLRVLYRSAQRADGAGPAVSLTAVLILLAAAGALALGLEPLFGAFLCGIACTASGAGVLHLAPLRVVVLGVLAPVFLASAGLRMDLGALVHPQVAMVAGAALAAAVVGKFAGAYLGARTARLDRWQAVALGGGMNARGVVEVVVAMVGLRLGILTPAMYTVVVMIAVVTSLMAAPIIRFAVRRIDQTPEEEVRWLAQSGPSVSETPAI